LKLTNIFSLIKYFIIIKVVIAIAKAKLIIIVCVTLVNFKIALYVIMDIKEPTLPQLDFKEVNEEIRSLETFLVNTFLL